MQGSETNNSRRTDPRCLHIKKYFNILSTSPSLSGFLFPPRAQHVLGSPRPKGFGNSHFLIYTLPIFYFIFKKLAFNSTLNFKNDHYIRGQSAGLTEEARGPGLA